MDMGRTEDVLQGFAFGSASEHGSELEVIAGRVFDPH